MSFQGTSHHLLLLHQDHHPVPPPRPPSPPSPPHPPPLPTTSFSSTTTPSLLSPPPSPCPPPPPLHPPQPPSLTSPTPPPPPTTSPSSCFIPELLYKIPEFSPRSSEPSHTNTSRMTTRITGITLLLLFLGLLPPLHRAEEGVNGKGGCFFNFYFFIHLLFTAGCFNLSSRFMLYVNSLVFMKKMYWLKKPRYYYCYILFIIYIFYC